MCLMLYMATDHEVAEQSVGRVSIAAIGADTTAGLAGALSMPFRRLIGVDRGCSCDFPSVESEVPIEYYDGMFDGEDAATRAHSVACLSSLFEWIAGSLSRGSAVELFPAWVGQEALPPRGRIDLFVQDLAPESFVFTERFLYILRSR